jgi:hypothetical protein
MRLRLCRLLGGSLMSLNVGNDWRPEKPDERRVSRHINHRYDQVGRSRSIGDITNT